jgi:hypothetical protein
LFKSIALNPKHNAWAFTISIANDELFWVEQGLGFNKVKGWLNQMGCNSPMIKALFFKITCNSRFLVGQFLIFAELGSTCIKEKGRTCLL